MKDIESLYNKAKEYLKNDQLGELQKTVTKILEIDPEYLPGQILFGALLLSIGQIQRAHEYFINLDKHNQNNPDIIFYLARIFTIVKKIKVAHSLYQKVLTLDPLHIQALIGLSVLYMQMSQFDLSMKTIDMAIEIEPENLDWKIIKVDFCFAAKDFKRAKPILESILKDKPKMLTMYHKLALCYVFERDAEMMEKTYLKSIDVFQSGYDEVPDIIEKDFPIQQYIQIAKTYHYSFNDYSTALAKLDEVSKLFPDSAEPFVWKGTIFLELDKKNNTNDNVESAKLNFEKSLQIDQNNSKALNNLGLIYFKEKNYNKAITNVEKSLQLTPTNYEGWTILAMCYKNINQWSDTAKSLEQAVKLTPQRHPNWLMLKRELHNAYVKSGQLQKATEMSTELRKLGILTLN